MKRGEWNRPCLPNCTCGKHTISGHKCLKGCTCGRHKDKLPIYCGVYALLNIESGEAYIGSSSDIRSRFLNHLIEMKSGKHYNSLIRKSVKEYGIEAFTLVILEECRKEDNLTQETYWLKMYNPEFNVFDEAVESNRGLTILEKTRQDRSIKHTGQISSMKGRTHSEETLAKMSKSQTGNQNAIGNKGPLGYTHTEESKVLMRKAWARRKATKLEGEV